MKKRTDERCKTVMDFLAEIAEHNDRSWFMANKGLYDSAREAFEMITTEMIARISDFDLEVSHLSAKDCTYRIYRDVRFSNDKRPYKIHMGAYINARGKKSQHGGYYMHMQPGNCLLAGGSYCLEPHILRAVRQSIVDNTDGIIGSVHYFSPEQARGGYVDEKSDIYSLGIVMYEMLTGRVPFDGDNPVNIALMHINGEMIPPSKVVDGVPPALEHIILKCTDKYPVNRFASADELIEALNNLEFVGSVVGNSVLMGGSRKNDRPIAETDYDDGEDYVDERASGKGKKEKKPMDKKKKIIIIVAAAVAAIAIGVIVAFATGLIGGKEIEAPNFTNMTVEEAQQAAEEYDLKIREGDEVISEDVEKGRIVSQDPAPGEPVRTGGTVTVSVSIGLGDGSVPNVVGLDEDEAREALEAADFEVGEVTTAASAEDEGTVIRQTPDAGEEAEKGTAVDLVVSDGSEAQAVVPYLIGRTVGEAQTALKNAGLNMGSISYEYSNTYAEGEVMWQQYDANAKLDKGSTVRVRVSRGPEPQESPNESPDGDED